MKIERFSSLKTGGKRNVVSHHFTELFLYITVLEMLPPAPETLTGLFSCDKSGGMFQTEIILFLQSFACDFLTVFFKFFTEIGKSAYAAPLVLCVLFGISFRIGFVLLHAVSWNGLFTFCLKEIFLLPRPSSVDLHVKLLEGLTPNPTPFESLGAEHFFGGFSKDVLEYVRNQPFDTWGFPSGHASHAVTLWGSMALYMKKAWFFVTALVMIFFISLSRMYLGRHFLADILGGLLLGLVVTWIFYGGIYRRLSLMNFLFEGSKNSRISLKTISFLFYFLFMPLLVLLIPRIPMEQVAALFGLNLGFILIRHRGFPKDTGSIGQRFGRVLLAGGVFFLLYAGMERGMGFVLSDEPDLIEFIRVAFCMFISLWGSVEMGTKLGLYKR